MLRSVELKDYMLTNPIRVKADEDLFTAISLILANKISGLCVVDDNDKLIGILSELDCLQAILSATYNNAAVGTVGEYMASENLITSSPNDDIIDVALDMLKHKKRRRPVVQDGKLIGQVTCRQLLNAVKEFSTGSSQ